MSAIRLDQVTFGYRDVPLFERFDLAVDDGEFFGLIGPNGAGKSTLLKLAAGLLKPSGGRVLLKEADVVTLSAGERARVAAVVPQESHFAFDYTVREVVMMGRHPYLGRFQRPGSVDDERVAEALEFVDAAALGDKSINEISGGEKQRVVLARALAQEPDILLLDEPTAHLDISHQRSFGELLTRLNSVGRTILLLSHDLNLASLLCTRLLLLSKGESHACGAPEQVLSRATIRAVYGVDTLVTPHPDSGRPQVLMSGRQG